MQQWDQMEQFMVTEAERDLLDGRDVRPCLVAFAGETPLLLAFVRPFAKGAYQQPLIELIALAAPLDADRLKFSITGRAWSMLDPIPPVDPALGDLRQRVLAIESVDGSAGSVRAWSTIHPYDVVGGAVRWGEANHLTGGEGWIPSALRETVRMRRELTRASITDIRAQADRCARLGHLVALGPTVAERLGLDARRH
ncbi:MAG: hypothetical protein ACRDZO_19670 [Egibacteraceae bacterium]